jgi:hypothetical protein
MTGPGAGAGLAELIVDPPAPAGVSSDFFAMRSETFEPDQVDFRIRVPQ